MKYFLDTEFYEQPQSLKLISIGIVAEDGREFYAENFDFAWEEVPRDHWLQENVLPHLSNKITKDFFAPLHIPAYRYKDIGAAILKWIGDDEDPEFWGYFADYDWVLFCWLFGTMMDLPKSFPMFCRDIQQRRVEMGVRVLPQLEGNAHNALDDARWTKQVYDYLEDLRSGT